MHSFILDDKLLQRLSPAARREELALLTDDLQDTKAQFRDYNWDPEGLESYPLSTEEAHVLVNGMPEAALSVLRVFIDHIDGDWGYATLEQLLGATGHTKSDNILKHLSWLLLRLRTVTGNPNAWLVNWHTKDWEWDEQQKTYTKGRYFISSDALLALKEALVAAG